MIFKFLDKDFNQLPWGVDVTNELSSVNIKNTLSDGSSIEIEAPITENVKVWIDEIRKVILSENDGNNFIVIADTSNKQNYFIIDSLEVSESKSKGDSNIKIYGYSADKLLSSRISVKKEYSGTLTSTLEDLIKGAGLGGVNDETYPYAISGEDRAKRFVPAIDLLVEITEPTEPVEISTTTSSVSGYVSDLVSTYGKRMYSFYDEIKNKLTIKIEDVFDKTVSSTGIKNLISSENNSITEYGYNIDRNERVNFIYATNGTGSITPYDGESDKNITSGLNRREDTLSVSDSTTPEADVSREFNKSIDSLEKINIKGEFGNTFNYGLDIDSVFIGDKVSVSLYDKSGTRYIVDDFITEMNIVIDTKTTGIAEPVYMPTIGYSDKNDEGEYISRRQKITITSNKNVQNSIFK